VDLDVCRSGVTDKWIDGPVRSWALAGLAVQRTDAVPGLEHHWLPAMVLILAGRHSSRVVAILSELT